MDERFTEFTEEALRAQDGKKVPVKSDPGGVVIGEATLKYDSEAGALRAQFEVKDPKLAEFLQRDTLPFIFRPREFRVSIDPEES